MKAKEFRSQSSDELLQKEKSLKKELSELRYQRKIGRVEKPSRFKAIKRDIARIMTILREKELQSSEIKNA